MKKRNLLLLFTLPALALCGCTIGKKDIPEEQKEEPATNPDTENLDGNDYDDWANSWSKPGHLYADILTTAERTTVVGRWSDNR